MHSCLYLIIYYSEQENAGRSTSSATPVTQQRQAAFTHRDVITVKRQKFKSIFTIEIQPFP